jgi:hypothetical protein
VLSGLLGHGSFFFGCASDVLTDWQPQDVMTVGVPRRPAGLAGDRIVGS